MEVERATCVAPATCVALRGGVQEVSLSDSKPLPTANKKSRRTRMGAMADGDGT